MASLAILATSRLGLAWPPASKMLKSSCSEDKTESRVSLRKTNSLLSSTTVKDEGVHILAETGQVRG